MGDLCDIHLDEEIIDGYLTGLLSGDAKHLYLTHPPTTEPHRPPHRQTMLELRP